MGLKTGIIVAVIILIVVIVIVLLFLNKKEAEKEIEKSESEIDSLIQQKIKYEEKQKNQKIYFIKNKYITNCELEFFWAIKSIIKDNYIIFPQVPLSQIIVKKTKYLYQNELYRIIDFCIFSKDYKPLVCIEINDKTHKEFRRYKRDKKVKDILMQAGLPLITLWTDYGINMEYIAKRLREHLQIVSV